MSQKETYHHGDLRQTLLNEALAWIAQEGISNISLRGLARRVGVSHNAPYRHFEDKTALLAAVAAEGFQSLTAALSGAISQDSTDYLGNLEAIGVAYVGYGVQNFARYRVMFGPALSECHQRSPLAAAAGDAFNVLVEAIVQGQAAGVIRRDNPEKIARIAWALVHGLVMLAIDGQLSLTPGDSLEEIAHYATRLLSAGLAPWRSPADGQPLQ
ncbi:MAG: TetR/AcrR family transcriptional regulator [Chloroflexaceae bacterium]|nr:TetR/AcrR family transcriptional regulator [Chloroflexaceae bacterium]